MWYGLSGCGLALVGVTWHKWVWNGLSRYGMASCLWPQCASVGVAWPQCVWDGLCGCDIARVVVVWPQCVYASEGVGLACPELVWHVLNGCGMASVGVSASVGLAWPRLV